MKKCLNCGKDIKEHNNGLFGAWHCSFCHFEWWFDDENMMMYCQIDETGEVVAEDIGCVPEYCLLVINGKEEP